MTPVVTPPEVVAITRKWGEEESGQRPTYAAPTRLRGGSYEPTTGANMASAHVGEIGMHRTL